MSGSGDRFPIQAVRRLAARQRQEHHGKDLDKSDEAEGQRGVTGIHVESLINFPAHRHRLHLHGQRKKTAAQNEIAIVGIPENGVRVGLLLNHIALSRNRLIFPSLAGIEADASFVRRLYLRGEKLIPMSQSLSRSRHPIPRATRAHTNCSVLSQDIDPWRWLPGHSGQSQ